MTLFILYFCNSPLYLFIYLFMVIILAFPSGVSNAKYLAFGIPNTNIHAS